MPILFYHLEKLYDHYGDGHDGNFTPSFNDSKAIFGHFVCRDGIGTDIVKLEIPESLYERNKKRKNELTAIGTRTMNRALPHPVATPSGVALSSKGESHGGGNHIQTA